MKINLGCGNDYLQGWLNIDKLSIAAPDLIMDIEQTPWAFEDNCAEEIYLKHVLEHVGKDSEIFQRIFQEVYRICEPGGHVRIQVTHPRHQAFLSDPTCVRPIIPELLECLDLAAVESWQNNGVPKTPLAQHWKVDFELVNVVYHFDAYWLDEYKAGRLDIAGLSRAMASYNNVVEWLDITLRARKPFQAGHAIRTADVICMERYGGLGDVLMALGAAKAVKALSGRPIALITSAAFRSLAEACPHIDYVAGDLRDVAQRFPLVKHANLNPAAFGLSRLHQLDAYLQSLGLSAETQLKSIDLDIGQAEEGEAEALIASWPARTPGRMRILLHASQGDLNRTWPMESWRELASRLIAAGHQVILIGNDGAPIPVVEALLSAVNALSLLGTVALMRRSDLLISTDSGPVQLAGATDIGVVGLYSVVPGERRLPYRHGKAGWRAEAVTPSCRFHPCYQMMQDPQIMEPYSRQLQAQTLDARSLFAQWCPDNQSYACMRHQITVKMVMAAAERVMAMG